MEQMKTCNTCGVEKDASLFPKAKRGKFGVRGDCKECHSHKNKITSPKRKAERKEYMKKYYQDNIEKFRRTPEQQAKYNERRRWLYKNNEDYRKERLKQAKEFREKNPTYKRDNELRYKYGITYEDFMSMRENQNKRCKICGEEFNETADLYVDHCHETGDVRGLLCNNCNFGIGHFKDDIELLERAIAYLERRGDVGKVDNLV